MHVLCIDDDEGLLYLMRSALETHSYQVTTCQDSAEVLPLLQANQFDTVILDQEMPKFSGLEIIKQARTLESAPPFIMVTGAGNEGVAVEAMRLGASDYVAKDTHLGYLQILPSVIQQVIHERELTQERQAAERAAQAERERSRLLNQFILDASHEFRIPLTIIQSSGELLQRLVDEPKQQSYITRILQQSNRILSLVNHLIHLSEIENTTSLNLAAVELHTIIQQALMQENNLITEKNLHLQLELADETITVLADTDELTAAFVELLSNAYQASAYGATLRVSLTVEDDAAVVTLCDDGVGMTEEQLPHIFERFYRADEAHTTPGFGLGLPIVACILDLHQGTIEITSELGKGSTVVVRLPLYQADSHILPSS